MIKVYTEVLGFNNLMYRYMSLPNSLSLADLAYYTLASYLSEEYVDFVIEVNGIPLFFHVQIVRMNNLISYLVLHQSSLISKREIHLRWFII